MKQRIEYRGEVLSGYVPDLPMNPVGCSEMLCPFLIPQVGWKIVEKPLDFCHDKMYNISTVKEDLTSKAGKEPERKNE